MPNLTRCNKCARQNCSLFKNIVDSTKCSYFVEMDKMKIPILNHILAKPKQVNTLNKLLEKYSLRIVETSRYPNFILAIER